MRVFILTEGGKELGFGHLARCLALSQAFRKMRIHPYLIVQGNPSVTKILNTAQYEHCNWLQDESRLQERIRRADIAIVDSYHADAGLYQAVSGGAKVAAFFDDNNRLPYPQGFVINGNIHAPGLRYPRMKGTEYLLGTAYTPLRKEFWNIPKRRLRKKIGNVIVTTGGSDSEKFTMRILKFLQREYPSLKTKVMFGALPLTSIRRLRNTTAEFYFSPRAVTIRDIMLWADIAITAGGQTTYELAAAGTPAVAFPIAENQMLNVLELENKKIVHYAGKPEDPEFFDRLSEKIELLQDYQLRKKASENGRRSIDGKGASRIVRVLSEALHCRRSYSWREPYGY